MTFAVQHMQPVDGRELARVIRAAPCEARTRSDRRAQSLYCAVSLAGRAKRRNKAIAPYDHCFLGAWNARVMNGTSSLITASVSPGSQRPFENA